MNLRAARLNQGLGVADLAALVDVPEASLYYWERSGGRPRDPAAAKRIADFFGVRVTDIWPLGSDKNAAAA